MTRLILVNIFVFIVANILISISKLSGANEYLILKWLALPSGIELFLSHFWTLVTYMFVHTDLLHVLFNLLWLYWMGNIFLEYIGSRQLLFVYIMGGMCGGILFVLLSEFINSSFLIGASASVMAIVVAIAVLLPEYTIHLMFIGPVRLKYVALISFILTTVIDLSQNTGGKIAHVGGALFGYLYMVQYKKGNDISKLFTSLFKKSNMKVAYKKNISDDDYSINKIALQKRVDAILDKISKSGYESLNKEEKEVLFKASGKK